MAKTAKEKRETLLQETFELLAEAEGEDVAREAFGKLAPTATITPTAIPESLSRRELFSKLSSERIQELLAKESPILRETAFATLPGLERQLKGGFFQRLLNPRIFGEFGPRLGAVFGGATTTPQEDVLVNEIIKQRNQLRLIEAGIPQEEFGMFGF